MSHNKKLVKPQIKSYFTEEDKKFNRMMIEKARASSGQKPHIATQLTDEERQPFDISDILDEFRKKWGII